MTVINSQLEVIFNHFAQFGPAEVPNNVRQKRQGKKKKSRIIQYKTVTRKCWNKTRR